MKQYIIFPMYPKDYGRELLCGYENCQHGGHAFSNALLQIISDTQIYLTPICGDCAKVISQKPGTEDKRVKIDLGLGSDK